MFRSRSPFFFPGAALLAAVAATILVFASSVVSAAPDLVPSMNTVQPASVDLGNASPLGSATVFVAARSAGERMSMTSAVALNYTYLNYTYLGAAHDGASLAGTEVQGAGAMR